MAMRTHFITNLSFGELQTLVWAVSQAEAWTGVHSGNDANESAHITLCREARNIVDRLKQQKKECPYHGE